MTVGVQVFRSSDQGASKAANTAGSRITNIFDPVLVNGYNSLSVSSVTRTGTTVTVTFGSAHGYDISAGNFVYLTISGAAPSDYNGTWKCTATSTTVVTFQIGTTPTTPATGTITGLRAGCGFTKPFTGTNKAAYLSPDGKFYLRVDDSATTGPALRIYRTMSDVDTGTDQTPTTAQLSTGVLWGFSTTNVEWVVTYKINAANFWCSYSSTAGFASGQALRVGKLIKTRAPGDDYAYLIQAGVATGARQEQTSVTSFATATTAAYLMRSYTQASGAVAAAIRAPKGMATSIQWGAANGGMPAYPHGPDSALIYDQVDVGESTAVIVRGVFPGVWIPVCAIAIPTTVYDTFLGTGAHAAKNFIILKHQNSAAMLFEISDTWDS